MGRYASASLFWGFPIASSPDEEYGWSEYEAKYEYAVRCGAARDNCSDEFVAVVLLKEETCTCEVYLGGTDFEECWIAIKTSSVKSCDGPTDCGELQVGDEWEQQLRDYCKVMGIPWQKPKWYINRSLG